MIKCLRNFIKKNSIFIYLILPFVALILYIINLKSSHQSKLKYLEFKKKNPSSLLKINDIKFYVPNKISSMSHSLIFNNIWEPEVIKLLKKINLKKFTIFDVGANIGWYTLNFYKLVGMNGKIYSFEPIPSTFLELKKNIKINNFKNIKINKLALSSNKKNKIIIGLPSFEFLGSAGSASEFMPFTVKYKPKVNSIDQFSLEKKIKKIDLIKLDVEGGELNILRGSLKTLKKNKPIIIIEIVDIHCFKFGHTPFHVHEFLKKIDYTGYYISTNEVLKLKKINEKNYDNGNYIFFDSKNYKLKKKLNNFI